MSRKPLLGSTDISEGFLVLSCSSVCSHAATKCLYLSGFSVQRSDLGPLEFEGSRASTKALQRFSTDRASGAVSDNPRLHLAGERSTGPTPRQHQLGDADSRVLPIASCSLVSVFSIRGFPVSARSHLVCGLGSATISHGSTGMLVKCWVRSR